MRFALNENDERIEVTSSGQRARCECCKFEVVGNLGRIREKYWRHLNKECDNWYEPITEWHLQWQNYFPKKNQEVVLTDKSTNVSHRADICLDNGLVIEIQNSPIKIDEILERERFYGEKKLIWVINGSSLAKQSFISYPREKIIYFFYIIFPLKGQTNFHIYRDYNHNDVINLFGDTKSFKKMFRMEKYLYSVSHNEYKFEFSEPIDFEKLRKSCEKDIRGIVEKHFGQKFYLDHMQLFKIEFGKRQKLKDERVILNKRYWRTCFDEMRFPVFFDKLLGLDEDDLYYYQKNQIFTKQKFTEKYLMYVNRL